ncbi:C-type lectin domain family 2 member B-like [Eublepharis macularius]|uniref:C-type lectin domain family 2 member B-like n=1 Tax=Eublepharis macularius TaxID=481883 RepID=A0AA97JAH2_EUBMA|nr:C-type lectin domain family 2 member B-like [Eublepharis macularius]
MNSKESSETDVRERKKFLPPDEMSKQGETPACDLSVSTIKTLLSNKKVVKCVAFLYRVVILLLLIGIGFSVVFAAKQIEQLGRSLVSQQQCGPPCPRYWIGYEGKCYFFSKEKRDWISSQHYCSSHSASLARIEKEEMDFVMRLKGKDIYWIGLRRVFSKDWTWADGENATMEVIGGGGDCAFLDNTAKAISSGCHTKLPWICSKPAAYATTEVADT